MSSTNTPNQHSNMQDLLQKLSQGVLESNQQQEPSSHTNNNSQMQQQDSNNSASANATSSSSSGNAPPPQNANSSQQQQQNTPLELTSIESLTKRLAKDLGTDFLNDDDDEDDDYNFPFDSSSEANSLSESQFRAQLLKDFNSLTSTSASSQIPKSHLKQLYLRILKQGQSLLYHPNEAEAFLRDLAPQEMSALWNVLAMSPDETIRYFDEDPVVIEALKNTPGFLGASNASTANASQQKQREKLWGELLGSLGDEEALNASEDAMTSQQQVDSLMKAASQQVKDAIALFEENLIQYSTHPEEILQLCNKLSQEDQKVFLDLLFLEYSPEKMDQKLRERQFKQQQESQLKKQAQDSIQHLSDINLDMTLVSHVVKEVLTHLRVYKKHPEKFDPLIGRLNHLEKEAFESMVKVFWDCDVKVNGGR